MSEPKIILCPFNLGKGCMTGSCRIYDVVNICCLFETMTQLLVMIQQDLVAVRESLKKPKKAPKTVAPKK